MANKRNFKKSVHDICGSIAADVLSILLPAGINDEQLGDYITDVARIQADTLAKASVSFDKTPRDFENRAAYFKARNAYFKKAYNQLAKHMADKIGELVTKMNKELPADVKASIKPETAE